MSKVESLSREEQRAYKLITTRDGILQSRLWKELDTDSRQGSRLATSLAEKGLIEREQTTNNGQRTYLLTPAADLSTSASQSASQPQPKPQPDVAGEQLSVREHRALSLIKDRGGIYQSELWKELDVTSRTGSRIATGLEEKETIRRTETTYNGQRTYFLYHTKKDLNFSLLMAGDMISPFVAADDGELDIDADEFTQWILALAHEER